MSGLVRAHRTRARVCACARARARARVCVCMFVRVCARVCVYMYVYVRTGTCLCVPYSLSPSLPLPPPPLSPALLSLVSTRVRRVLFAGTKDSRDASTLSHAIQCNQRARDICRCYDVIFFVCLFLCFVRLFVCFLVACRPARFFVTVTYLDLEPVTDVQFRNGRGLDEGGHDDDSDTDDDDDDDDDGNSVNDDDDDVDCDDNDDDNDTVA